MPVNRIEPGSLFAGLNLASDFTLREEALRELEARITQTPVDVRNALSNFTPDSDPHQADVVAALDSTIRLVAPAGSGKTQTVVNRVLQRVKGGVAPSRILVLTFDNAAATSIRAKATSLFRTLGVAMEGWTTSTLNAYGYGLLRLSFPDDYRPIVEGWRRGRWIRDIRDQLRKELPALFHALPGNIRGTFYLDFFSLLKNNLFDPRRPDAQAFADFLLRVPQANVLFPAPENRDSVERAIRAVLGMFIAYERLLEQNRLLDFDDQKLRAFERLNSTPAAREALAASLSEVIVDEFQDINRLDFELIKLLAQKATLVVTGDDDQAIYGFRGCSPDFIIDLEQHLDRPVRSFELRMNYRCPPEIVKHADQLIRHNQRRIPKEPIAVTSGRAEIQVVSSLAAALEAPAVVATLNRIRTANHLLHYSDFAVLYRTNAQSLPLQLEFILNDIPYYVREEDNIVGNEILGRMLGALRAKLAYQAKSPMSPDDAVDVVRAYFRSISGTQASALRALFRECDDFLQCLESPAFYAILEKARTSHLATSVTRMFAATSLLDTLELMANHFKGLRGMIGSLEDAIQDQVPLGEIFELAANFRGEMQDFVSTIQKAIDRARQTNAGHDRAEGVSLLTYFRSKGLQWHTVILTTCNEGLIPHTKAPVEDERRLFYVGMTRASSNLILSYLAKAVASSVAPSRFLYESGILSR